MAELTTETEVFSVDAVGRALIFFTARRTPGAPSEHVPAVAARAAALLRRWGDEGWVTSVAQMFGDDGEAEVFESGFAHEVDVVGAWEAPDLARAYEGIGELQAAGWDELFATEWIVGRREFQPVASPMGRTPDAKWALFALWEWNDGWQAATPAERLEYDAECDVAFAADIGSGVSIAGRHRLDSQSSWHHLGIWEAPTLDHITRGMLMHEKVADFKFTTSRHFLGRRRPATEFLGAMR